MEGVVPAAMIIEGQDEARNSGLRLYVEIGRIFGIVSVCGFGWREEEGVGVPCESSLLGHWAVLVSRLGGWGTETLGL